MTASTGKPSHALRLLLGVQAIEMIPWALRRRALRMAGARIDGVAFLEPGVSVVAGPLRVGDRAYINKGCLLDCRGGIEIGARTLIAPRVMVLTATHPVMDHYPRAGETFFEPVVIEDDVWIGAGATILPGSVIGRGCVVASGAVVRGRLERDTMYGGVPARPIRQLAVQAAAAPARAELAEMPA